ncbi:hypothetical protein SAMN05216233_12014 [Desulfoluna spongiiphila]|uniref:Uncharacterized protein n=1 Tax=Desulfoluna spongiiphila TaxID=419481 RepID=A0A1G5IHL8_9BACT|nr:hypothetical protein SAMN05216233_12014 [Desulfoluna spongiiphila]
MAFLCFGPDEVRQGLPRKPSGGTGAAGPRLQATEYSNSKVPRIPSLMGLPRPQPGTRLQVTDFSNSKVPRGPHGVAHRSQAITRTRPTQLPRPPLLNLSTGSMVFRIVGRTKSGKAYVASLQAAPPQPEPASRLPDSPILQCPIRKGSVCLVPRYPRIRYCIHTHTAYARWPEGRFVVPFSPLGVLFA